MNLTINLVNLLNNLGFVVTNIVLSDLNRVPEKKSSLKYFSVSKSLSGFLLVSSDSEGSTFYFTYSD